MSCASSLCVCSNEITLPVGRLPQYMVAFFLLVYRLWLILNSCTLWHMWQWSCVRNPYETSTTVQVWVIECLLMHVYLCQRISTIEPVFFGKQPLLKLDYESEAQDIVSWHCYLSIGLEIGDFEPS